MPKKGVSKLGHQLRMMRVDRGLSQSELSVLAGVSRFSILRLENDRSGGRDILPKVWRALTSIK